MILTHVFDHLDEAESAERRVLARVDHHHRPAHNQGKIFRESVKIFVMYSPGHAARHALLLAPHTRVRLLLGHRVEKFVLNKTQH